MEAYMISNVADEPYETIVWIGKIPTKAQVGYSTPAKATFKPDAAICFHIHFVTLIGRTIAEYHAAIMSHSLNNIGASI